MEAQTGRHETTLRQLIAALEALAAERRKGSANAAAFSTFSIAAQQALAAQQLARQAQERARANEETARRSATAKKAGTPAQISRDRVETWLKNRIAKATDASPMPLKAELLAECRAENDLAYVSERAFNDAWTAVVPASWKRPGTASRRPKGAH